MHLCCEKANEAVGTICAESAMFIATPFQVRKGSAYPQLDWARTPRRSHPFCSEACIIHWLPDRGASLAESSSKTVASVVCLLRTYMPILSELSKSLRDATAAEPATSEASDWHRPPPKDKLMQARQRGIKYSPKETGNLGLVRWCWCLLCAFIARKCNCCPFVVTTV